MSDEDDDDKPQGPSVFARVLGGFVSRPLLAGYLLAIIGFVFLTLALPAIPEPDAALVPVAVTPVVQNKTPTQSALPEKQVAEMQAVPPGEEVKPEVAPEPEVASIPVVADIAVLITDVGLSRRVAEAIDKNLPVETSLAISVYATDPAGTAKAFEATGRDIWMQAAAESNKIGVDAGPLAISGGLPKKDNVDLLKKQMAAMGANFIGIYVPDDADITQQSDLWRDIALDAIASNKMLLDGTNAKVATELYVQKSEAKISAYLKTDVVIDGATSPAVLEKALVGAVPNIIKAQQSILVIKRPTVAALETVAKWIGTLASQGIRLVPASKFTGLKP